MHSIRYVLSRISTLIKLIAELAIVAVMFQLVLIVSANVATALWGTVFEEFVDESIGGHAMFMFVISATSAVSAELVKHRLRRECLQIASRLMGFSALLVTGAAVLNQVFPTILALSWPVTQEWNVHITPVAVVLAAVILLIRAARKRMTDKN